MYIILYISYLPDNYLRFYLDVERLAVSIQIFNKILDLILKHRHRLVSFGKTTECQPGRPCSEQLHIVSEEFLWL